MFIVFGISAALKDRTGILLPFNIFSTVEYDGLLALIAKKMDRFPDNLKLCYRLNTDKSSAGAISIQSPAELDIFKDHMRTLLVPPRLANGQLSKRAPKQVIVHFEVAGDSTDSGSAKSKGTRKKACLIFREIVLGLTP
jgi:hypothetical protein